jgi:hypothetical protein
MSSIPPEAAAAAAAAAERAAEELLQLDANQRADQIAIDDDDHSELHRLMMHSEEQGYHHVVTNAVAAALGASSNSVERDTVLALSRDVIEEYGASEGDNQGNAELENIPILTQAGKARTKGSRACDECRRKKTKCDVMAVVGGASCTSCRKNNLECQFQRVQQKRGPSRGYIRELSNRVKLLEGTLRPSPLRGSFIDSMETYAEPSGPSLAGQKRARSTDSDHVPARSGFVPINPDLPRVRAPENSLLTM